MHAIGVCYTTSWVERYIHTLYTFELLGSLWMLWCIAAVVLPCPGCCAGTLIVELRPFPNSLFHPKVSFCGIEKEE